MKGKWIVIESENGDKKRVNLSSLTVIWEGNKETGTGTFRNAVYLMPKAKRVIVETYSQWENPMTHVCYGTSYHFADDREIADLADDLQDGRLLNLVPVMEDE